MDNESQAATEKILSTPTTEAIQPVPKPSTLRKWGRLAVVVLTPLIFIFLLFLHKFYKPPGVTYAEVYGLQLKWIYLVLVVGIYLTTNVLNFETTSILPFILIPLYGLWAAKDVATEFMSSVNMAFVGGLLVVFAIQGSGLMRRWSLWILKTTSGQYGHIFMYSFFISLLYAMLIGCGPAGFFMIKLVDNILEQMKLEVGSGTMGDERMALAHDIVIVAVDIQHEEAKEGAGDEKKPEETKDAEVEKESPEKPSTNIKPEKSTSATRVDRDVLKDFVKKFDKENDAYLKQFGGELLYGAAVAANIGGTIFPTSSPVGEDLFTLTYTFSSKDPPNSKTLYEWTALSWIWYSLPLLLLNAFAAMLVLWVMNYSNAPISLAIRRIMRIDDKRLSRLPQSPLALSQLHKLFTHKHHHVTHNGFTFHEVATIFALFVFMILNFFRYPRFMIGWASVIRGVYLKGYRPIHVGVSSVMLIIVIFVFVIPKKGWRIFIGRSTATEKPCNSGLVVWKTAQTKFPWPIVFLLAAARCMGRLSENTVAVPLSIFFAKLDAPISMQCAIMTFSVLLNLLLPNPGTTLVVQYVWQKLMKMKSPNLKPYAPMLMPVLSATSLTFTIPASSIPNALVFQSDKGPTFSYYVKFGIPIFIITFIITLLYANFIWGASYLTPLYYREKI